ncbi:MAG: TIGR00269 family protein [Nitrososphaerota archaeon]|nr:TIGR00269 family protein [Nitrososphaerota archaeon]
MFEIDDRIAVAVSGGKDSLSLLHILFKIEQDFPKSSICAITVDEGISGYRDEAIEIAKKNCAELGIAHIIVSFKELYGYTLDEIVEKVRGEKLTPCAYCGILRRKAINIGGQLAGATKIATAHTLDDEIQTFFLNIIHGEPLRIKRTLQTENFKVGFIPRVKPLCEVLEKETALYAYVTNITFQDEPCPYAGEALRNDVRRILNYMEEKHPGMKYTIYRSYEKLRDSIMLKEIPFKICSDCGEPSSTDLCQTCQILREISRV